MKGKNKFLLGGTLIIGIIGYLMVTGMRDSMVYYHTPSELVQMASNDPGYHEVGVKLGGRVVPGSIEFDQRTLDLTFTVTDIEEGVTQFPVVYQGPLPDTFEDGVDVVVDGRFAENGVFEATALTTKCGSRYEAGPEDYLS